MTPIFNSTFSEYRGISQIGSGGSGTVWRAVDPEGKEYAVKHLDPTSVSVERTKRFKNELSFCNRSPHKNIISVIDWGYITLKKVKCPFYVMPIYPFTLRRFIVDGIAKDRVLPCFSQILDGIEAAHMLEIWHRDLKPENILCSSNMDSLVVADFGIAHFAEEQILTTVATAPHARMANFQYAAPEQRARPSVADARADIYALGLMLNEMFTGVLAHGVGFRRIAEVAPDYVYLDEIVDSMLHQDPTKRPQSIRTLKEHLIARGNDFVTQQKLSALKQTVIPSTSSDDDALILSPPEIVGAKWENGYLFLTLSQNVNDLWAACFNNIGNYTSIMGKGPGTFSIRGSTLKVQTDDAKEAEQLVEYSKTYVKSANTDYKRHVELDLLKRKQKAEAELKHRIAQEEKTRAINSRLRI